MPRMSDVQDVIREIEGVHVQVEQVGSLLEKLRTLHERTSRKSRETDEQLERVKTLTSKLRAEHDQMRSLRSSMSDAVEELTAKTEMAINAERAKLEAMHEALAHGRDAVKEELDSMRQLEGKITGDLREIPGTVNKETKKAQDALEKVMQERVQQLEAQERDFEATIRDKADDLLTVVKTSREIIERFQLALDEKTTTLEQGLEGLRFECNVKLEEGLEGARSAIMKLQRQIARKVSRNRTMVIIAYILSLTIIGILAFMWIKLKITI